MEENQAHREAVEELSRLFSSWKGKHGVSDIDAATRLLMLAATLYLKNETEAGRTPTAGDFGHFSRSSFRLSLLVQGGIGAGKSTVLAAKAAPEGQVHVAPREQWSVHNLSIAAAKWELLP